MEPDDTLLIQAIDSLVQETYPPAEPGAAVLVARDGEIIFRKGQGMAHLELGVPIEPDMVFRLGSITKQFTAVAILMLAEQGKLALDDPLTRFLPDYPTHDHLITVEHLLTHTSGIQSYTDLPEWEQLSGKDFTVQELIDFFKCRPMQSAPGKRWTYNNSGYFLLGTLIEQASGLTYEQFLQQHVFDPLGMAHSCYDKPARITPRRAAGYSKGPEGYTNAAYLSMTQPYAAGALASTVDDLLLWDSALYTDRLLKPATLQRAFAPGRLADGSSTSYGYGWVISEYAGHVLTEHGGGINGFRTHALRVPAMRGFVAVLSNNESVDPEGLAFKIAAWVVGQPYQEPAPVELSPEVLARYEGVYRISATEQRRITREGSRLFSQRGQGRPLELAPLSTDEFFFKESSLYRLRFVRDANDAVIAVEMRGRAGLPEINKKIDEPVVGTSSSAHA